MECIRQQELRASYYPGTVGDKKVAPLGSALQKHLSNGVTSGTWDTTETSALG